MDFSDKAVLVTGASRGIGRAIARQFAACGARVAVHYRAGRAGAAETLAALAGGPHLLVQADVGDANAVEQMVDVVVGGLGRIDVLVNNAGIYEAHPPADASYDHWRASWRRILDTNLLGAANAAWCAARHMMRQGGGRIVNVSSRGAFRGEPEAPAYGASKAGMNAMSQSLALALAPTASSSAPWPPASSPPTGWPIGSTVPKERTSAGRARSGAWRRRTRWPTRSPSWRRKEPSSPPERLSMSTGRHICGREPCLSRRGLVYISNRQAAQSALQKRSRQRLLRESIYRLSVVSSQLPEPERTPLTALLLMRRE